MLRVVVDTNVLVSALLTPSGGSGLILAAIERGDVTVVSSEHLIDELASVLARGTFRSYVSTARVEEYVAAIRRHADLVGDPDEIDPVSRDLDDDYLVALAHTEDADAIVTGDEDLTSLRVEARISVSEPCPNPPGRPCMKRDRTGPNRQRRARHSTFA